MKMKIKRSLLASAVALACGNALGATHSLCAGTFNKTMPDGSEVQMWGYAQIATPTTACPANGLLDGASAYTAPGPQLDVPPADTSLTINLKNNLAELTSVVIPGQTEDLPAMAPVMVTVKGTPRVRSFTHEVEPGATGVYTWGTATNPLKPGSYAYQTGTHPAKQVQMGLYGAMVKDFDVDTAYPSISYDTQVIEFLSEIDPDLHARVATGNFGAACELAANLTTNTCTSTIGYNPKWFLVNGEVFVDGNQTAAPALITAGNTGETTLIRFINMGLRSHSMVLQGASMKIVAEDGHVLPVQHDQYSLMVAAGKTHDALFTPSTQGVYPLYERMHNLSVADTTGIKAGGLMSFLNVGAGAATLKAVNDVFSGNEDTLIAGNVLANDTFPPGSTAQVVTSPATGSLTLNSNGSFTYTPVADANGHISFDYQISDGATPAPNLSNTATVDLNIVAVNDAPVIDSDPLTSVIDPIPNGSATEDTPYSYTVPATDVDAGQTLSYSLVSAPAGMTIDASTGAISWTPTNAQVGPANNVTVKVSDSSGAVNNFVTQSFSIAVENVNDAPTLAYIPAQNAVVNTAFNLTAVGSDIDVSDTLAYTFSCVPACPVWLSNTTVADGHILSGMPDADGSYDVTVTVTDSATPTPLTAIQTFALNVTGTAANPVVYFSTFGNTNPTGVPGTADDGDIYSWTGSAFTRVVDMTTKGVPSSANVDEIKVIDATHFYLSFVGDTSLPGIGAVQDEDIVYYNGATWSVAFDATAKGLTATNHDIDAFDLSGSNVYFSLSGSSTASNPPGVNGIADTGDIYLWNGNAFSRFFDMTTHTALTPDKGWGPAALTSTSASNIDGLKYVDATHFYTSFVGNVTLNNSTNAVLAGAPINITVQDEDIVYYNNGRWEVYFDGTDPDNNPLTANGLTSGNQDIDGFDIK